MMKNALGTAQQVSFLLLQFVKKRDFNHMPRPRLTFEQAEQRGATRINPGRFSDRRDAVKAQGTLGSAPKHLSPELKAMWKELAGQLPDGLTSKADRMLVEMTVTLLHELRTDATMKTSARALLLSCLSRLGLTPQDRLKMHVPSTAKSSNSSEWDAILQ